MAITEQEGQNYSPINTTEGVFPRSDGQSNVDILPDVAPDGDQSTTIHKATELQPDKDVADYVTAHPESPEVPPDLKKLGVKSTSSPKYVALQAVKLPVDDISIINLRKKSIKDAGRWWGAFYERILLRAGGAIKMVHGKAIRVLTSKGPLRPF